MVTGDYTPTNTCIFFFFFTQRLGLFRFSIWIKVIGMGFPLESQDSLMNKKSLKGLSVKERFALLCPPTSTESSQTIQQGIEKKIQIS